MVSKHTSEDNLDKARLAEVVKIVRGFLTRVNEESGKAENKFNLAQLDQQLVFRNIEPVVRIHLTSLCVQILNKSLVGSSSARREPGAAI